MKTIHLGLMVFMLLALGAKDAKAQYVRPFAAGIRASPDGGGVNGRFFFNENFSTELQFNVSGGKPGGIPLSSGKSMTGIALLQYHVNIYGPQLRLFMGLGAHYGTWERYKNKSQSEGLFGFDGILGVEYLFPSVPISLSLDAKPSFNYISGLTYFPNNAFGLGVRYNFGAWKEYTPTKVDTRE